MVSENGFLPTVSILTLETIFQNIREEETVVQGLLDSLYSPPWESFVFILLLRQLFSSRYGDSQVKSFSLRDKRMCLIQIGLMFFLLHKIFFPQVGSEKGLSVPTRGPYALSSYLRFSPSSRHTTPLPSLFILWRDDPLLTLATLPSAISKELSARSRGSSALTACISAPR